MFYIWIVGEVLEMKVKSKYYMSHGFSEVKMFVQEDCILKVCTTFMFKIFSFLILNNEIFKLLIPCLIMLLQRRSRIILWLRTWQLMNWFGMKRKMAGIVSVQAIDFGGTRLVITLIVKLSVIRRICGTLWLRLELNTFCEEFVEIACVASQTLTTLRSMSAGMPSLRS